MTWKTRDRITGAVNRALGQATQRAKSKSIGACDVYATPLPTENNDPYSLKDISKEDLFHAAVERQSNLDRQIGRWRRMADGMQEALGKVAILRHENNKLRAKNVPQPSKEVKLSYPEPFYIVGLQSKGTAPVEVIWQCPPSRCIKDLMEELRELPEIGMDKAVVVVKVNPGARPFILFRNARDDRGWKATHFDGKDQFLSD